MDFEKIIHEGYRSPNYSVRYMQSGHFHIKTRALYKIIEHILCIYACGLHYESLIFLDTIMLMAITYTYKASWSRAESIGSCCWHSQWAQSMGVAMMPNIYDTCRLCHSIQSTATDASFSSNLTDSLCLWITQAPRSQDLSIFLWATTTIGNRTDYFTPCTCAGGNHWGTAVKIICLW